MSWIEVAPTTSTGSILFTAEFDNGSGLRIFGANQVGQLFEWDEVGAWIPRITTQTFSGFTGLVVFDNGSGDELYAINDFELVKWNGATSWVSVTTGASNSKMSMIAFAGTIFAGDLLGNLWRWDNAVTWTLIAPTLNPGSGLLTFGIFKGKLYAVGAGTPSGGGNLQEFNGVNALTQVAPNPAALDEVVALVVFDMGSGDELYGSTNPEFSSGGIGGRLLKWNEVNAWVEVASTLTANEGVGTLVVEDGELFGGTNVPFGPPPVLGGGRLLKWDKASAWIEVAERLNDQFQINTMLIHPGSIFAGTSPDGLLFKFGAPVPPPEPIFPNLPNSDYFDVPTQKEETKSVSSEMPDGRYWLAKWLETKVIYALMFGAAGATRLLKQMFSSLSTEFNLYTAVELLGSLWEKSVGLPDTRLGNISQSLDARRLQVQQRLRKKAIVTMVEMQLLIDATFPDYGIWLSSGGSGQFFRYDFRFFLGSGSGGRATFVFSVNIPWLAIDPDDLENSPLTQENLFSWLRDFIPSYVELNPIFYPQDSYCIITNPQGVQSPTPPQPESQPQEVYSLSDGAGGFLDRIIYWKQIDKDGTVINHADPENILPTTTDITRSFTDSDTNLISATNDVKVITLL